MMSARRTPPGDDSAATISARCPLRDRLDTGAAWGAGRRAGRCSSDGVGSAGGVGRRGRATLVASLGLGGRVEPTVSSISPLSARRTLTDQPVAALPGARLCLLARER